MLSRLQWSMAPARDCCWSTQLPRVEICTTTICCMPCAPICFVERVRATRRLAPTKKRSGWRCSSPSADFSSGESTSYDRSAHIQRHLDGEVDLIALRGGDWASEGATAAVRRSRCDEQRGCGKQLRIEENVRSVASGD